jgi:alpha-glucoside transport system substrate-binding protein
VLLLVQCAPGADDATADLTGARLEVVAAWSGVEQQRFAAVLRQFSARTGASVLLTEARNRVPEVLAARLAEGRPPDVALLPQPGLLRRLAANGQLVPLDPAVVEVARRNYSPV